MQAERFLTALKAKRQTGQTQANFAASIGVSKQNWSSVCKGRKRIPWPLVVRAVARWPELAGVFLMDLMAAADDQRRREVERRAA
jgi:transcriptional regulator with XRE-family HTH domain